MTPAPPPHFRLARPSRDLDAATTFYSRGLGLVILAAFEDHAGIDGVILGRSEWPYHLELTRWRSEPARPTRSDEELIVFFLPDRDLWRSTVERLHAVGAREVVNSNPYWAQHGRTYEDPDGNLIVLQNAEWTTGT